MKASTKIAPDVLSTGRHSQADRPFPQFSDVVLLAPTFGISNYYAGLFRLEKQLSRGLSMRSTYTWSKFLANTNDTANRGAGALGMNYGPYSNLYNRAADYGPVESDIEHRFAFSAVCDLPLRFTFAGLASLQSGPPLTAVTAVSQSGNGYWAGPQRANVSRDPNLPVGGRSILQWFDTAAFTAPVAYTFGNEGVGIIRAPGSINFDLSLLRSFAITEHANLQLRGDFFNAFNHTNLDPPCLIFGPSFGLINASGPARQIQHGVRLIW
jgi:hypothetical protein